MTNPAPAASVNALVPDPNTRGTSFSAALEQSARSQASSAQNAPSGFRVPGNTLERASSAQIAGHGATVQIPAARVRSDAGLSAKAGAKARPIAAVNPMAGGKPGPRIVAAVAHPPIGATAPNQGRTNILAASAGQRSEQGASDDTSNVSPALLATLTPFDEGAAAAALFSPAQSSIDTQGLEQSSGLVYRCGSRQVVVCGSVYVSAGDGLPWPGCN